MARQQDLNDRGPPDLFGTSNGDPNDDRITRNIFNHGVKRRHFDDIDESEDTGAIKNYRRSDDILKLVRETARRRSRRTISTGHWMTSSLFVPVTQNSPSSVEADTFADAAIISSPISARVASKNQESTVQEELLSTPNHNARDPNGYKFATTPTDGKAFEPDPSSHPVLHSTPIYRNIRQERGRLPGSPGKEFDILDEGSNPLTHEQESQIRVVLFVTPGQENDAPPQTRRNAQPGQGDAVDEDEETDQEEEDDNAQLARDTWDHRGSYVTPARRGAVRTAFDPVRRVEGSPSPENRPSANIQSGDSAARGVTHVRTPLRGGAEAGSWSSSTRLRLRGGAGDEKDWGSAPEKSASGGNAANTGPAPLLSAEQDRRRSPHLWGLTATPVKNVSSDFSVRDLISNMGITDNTATNTPQATPVAQADLVAQANTITHDRNFSADDDHGWIPEQWLSTSDGPQLGSVAFQPNLTGVNDESLRGYSSPPSKERLRNDLNHFNQNVLIGTQANQVKKVRDQGSQSNAQEQPHLSSELGSWRSDSGATAQFLEQAGRPSSSNIPSRDPPIPIQPPPNAQGPRPLLGSGGNVTLFQGIRGVNSPPWISTGSGQSSNVWVQGGTPVYNQHEPGLHNWDPSGQTELPAYNDGRLHEAYDQASGRGTSNAGSQSQTGPSIQHQTTTELPVWDNPYSARENNEDRGPTQVPFINPHSANGAPGSYGQSSVSQNRTQLANEELHREFENNTWGPLDSSQSSAPHIFDQPVPSGLHQALSPTRPPVLAFQPPYTPQQPASPTISPGPLQVEYLDDTSTRPRLALYLTIMQAEYRPETWTEQTLAQQIGQSLERYLAGGAHQAHLSLDASPALRVYDIIQIMNHLRVYLAGRYGIGAGPPRVFISVGRPHARFSNQGVYSPIDPSIDQRITELRSSHNGGQQYDLRFTVSGSARTAILSGSQIPPGPGREARDVAELWIVMDRGQRTSPLWQWVSIGFWDLGAGDTEMG